MDNSELESFFNKFRCLWNSGFDAHLELDSHAGQAWVSLRVRLGHAPGPLQPQAHFPHPQNRTRNGPSRQRRRARRAAARAEQPAGNEHVETENVVNAEEAVILNSTEKVAADNSALITEIVPDGSDNSFTENIPQFDGGLDDKSDDDPNFCVLCKNSDEIESAEDLSYHMMNDHDPEEVLATFGRNWIEERRYCIRRSSPFENWFFTPII